MQLLCEEINTQVAVLAGCCRSCDADDLARTALKNQNVAKANVMAGDCDGIGSIRRFSNWGRLGRAGTGDLNVDLLTLTEGASNLFSGTVKTVAEGVVVTLSLVSSDLCPFIGFYIPSSS